MRSEVYRCTLQAHILVRSVYLNKETRKEKKIDDQLNLRQYPLARSRHRVAPASGPTVGMVGTEAKGRLSFRKRPFRPQTKSHKNQTT